MTNKVDYFVFDFVINSKEEFHKDLLRQAVAEAGFDSFEDTDEGFKAYILQQVFSEDLLESTLSDYRDMVAFSYTRSDIAGRNWNEEWESNFPSINIDDTCYIRATFHEPRPEIPYEIVIDPKMSFGTGHHQTTTMMLRFILANSPEGKRVMDMGCGTAILAILARKLGATDVLAIDYDPVCFESAIENAQLNDCSIEVLCGSKELIPQRKFDVIYANINRNILLDQIARYAEAMHKGAELYLSGFYLEDIDILLECAAQSGLSLNSKLNMDKWAALKLIKD